MARLTKGGREITEQMLADLAATEGAASTLDHQISEILAGLTLSKIKFNPNYAKEELDVLRHLARDAYIEQAAALDRARRRIRDELEPMLQRQERLAEQAALPEQVATLRALVEAQGERIAALERSGRLSLVRKAE
jgi:hypothetical protein